MLIFLDIDGVMVPAKNWEGHTLLVDGFYQFSDKAVNTLRQFISAETTVILTTSHKSRFTVDEWKNIFRNRGLEIENLKKLNEGYNLYISRKDDILVWFSNNNPTEEFVIIDDDKSLNDLPPKLKEKLILTNALIGLTDSHIDKIKSILTITP
ncbi:MAG: HAD domain-containing protein [Sphingobacteriales bacterium JAD_PAG50586_3]|nr:MAG: HAD domain-containing protein [Sphingobacteriales bacterium JAD_PAG50586_3]